MATDSSHAVDAVTSESVREAYVSPTADFLIISGVVSAISIAGVAVIHP